MSPASKIEDQNKALVRRWFEEVWNQGREDLIDELRAPDAVARGLGEGNQKTQGPSPFRAFYANLRGTFPDLYLTIDDMIAAGEKVAVRLTAEGTHTGDALAPATGRKVKFSGIIITRIVEGKIAEAWNHLDQLWVLRQIGALPPESGPDRFLTLR